MTGHQADFEDILRRALHAAADSVHPSDDGLERIRARLTTPYPLPVAWTIAAYSEVTRRTLGWSHSIVAWLHAALRSARERYEVTRPRTRRQRHLARVHLVAFVAALSFVMAISVSALTPFGQQVLAQADAFLRSIAGSAPAGTPGQRAGVPGKGAGAAAGTVHGSHHPGALTANCATATPVPALSPVSPALSASPAAVSPAPASTAPAASAGTASPAPAASASPAAAGTAAGHGGHGRSETSWPGPDQREPDRLREPSRRQPVRSGQPEPQPEPVQPEPEPVDPEPEPVQPEPGPVQPEPVRPGLGQPEPVQLRHQLREPQPGHLQPGQPGPGHQHHAGREHLGEPGRRGECLTGPPRPTARSAAPLFQPAVVLRS